MKNQALFSWKDKNKKLECHLLQFLFGALKVKGTNIFLLRKILQKMGVFLHKMFKILTHYLTTLLVFNILAK